MTKYVSDLELMFPAFSISKRFPLQCDIVVVPENKNTTFNVILSIETLAKFGAILNFSEKSVKINSHKIAMTTNAKIGHCVKITHFAKKEEPASTKEATKRRVGILDASHKKLDLPKVIADMCKHLSHTEQRKLLLLLESYKELFDGTLGDFQTPAVKLNLKESTTRHTMTLFAVV